MSTPARRSGKSTIVKASLELALLGLIAEYRAISGYDIVKLFDLSMVHYWHALHGQIYPTLERMQAEALITSREVIQRGRPNKRLYSITAAGRAVLLEWLSSPCEDVKLKHAALLRCRFLGHLGPDAAIEHLKAEREGCAAILRRYLDIEKEGRRRFPSGYPDANTMFAWFTLRRGIIFAEESMRWLDWAIGEVEINRNLFMESKPDPARSRHSVAS